MDEYHKVGTTFRTSFDYPSSVTPNTYVTGLAQSDFTLTVAKNGVIGASTVGIVLTDLVTPTGSYDVAVSGTTGFAAATGVYKFIVRRTTVIGDEWAFDVRVTSDGTGAGSWGDATFTATASNGRVMSGGLPVQGATVRILTAAGALYIQTTTDALGLWGPVYFNTNGTYTIAVQKSGYTLATATLTVAALVATGPGTDITLTASSTSTGIAASELWARFKRVLRDRSGNQADELARQGVDDALTQIAQECLWPWYHTDSLINLNALYNTGTVAITYNTATLTLTGGTWPTWAASAEVYINGRTYTVLTRDSATVLTLANAFGEAAVTGNSYTIAQCRYDMPSDLTAMDRMLFEPAWPYGARPVSLTSLFVIRSAWQYGQSRPGVFAVSRDEFTVWPWPTTTKSVTILYYRRPPLLVSGTDQADWDPLQLPVLHRAIEYQASLVGECICGSPEECFKRYRDAVTIAQASNRTAVNPPQTDDQNYWDEDNARSWGDVRP